MREALEEYWWWVLSIAVAVLFLWSIAEVKEPPREPTNCVAIKKRPALRFGLRRDGPVPYPVLTPMWDRQVKCDGEPPKWIGEVRQP